jgi:hypothetical protein
VIASHLQSSETQDQRPQAKARVAARGM